MGQNWKLTKVSLRVVMVYEDRPWKHVYRLALRGHYGKLWKRPGSERPILLDVAAYERRFGPGLHDFAVAYLSDPSNIQKLREFRPDLARELLKSLTPRSADEAGTRTDTTDESDTRATAHNVKLQPDPMELTEDVPITE